MGARGLERGGLGHPPEPSSQADPAEEKGFLTFFGQSILALAFDLGDLIPGLIFAFSLDLFSRRMWSIVAYPCLLTTRGMVGGVFCGRLTSGLWLGTMRPCFLGNTDDFKDLYSSIMVLSSLSALMMVASIGLYGLSWGLGGRDMLDMTVAVITTMALSFLTATPITALVAFASFKHGLDPDVITYPVGSLSCDTLVTCCYTATLILMYHGSMGRGLAYAISSAFLASCALKLVRGFGREGFKRGLKESLASSALVVAISGLTGTTLGRMSIKVGLRPEVAMAYPALIGTVGDVGSIVGSTATTKMWSGELEADAGAFFQHRREIAAAWSSSLLMFTAYGFLSSLIASGDLPILLATFFLTNLMAVGLVVILSLSVGILSYRYGLDPDNFVIPVESSAADAITTLSLLLALRALSGLWVR
ncbi:hypothetical protein DRO32_00300 [Candidatus Bathyarchaeota archaeon]|nr:MAG: hypothetical protein DRO32_00300 [Candidatus Bathyarchaeota archaeon]